LNIERDRKRAAFAERDGGVSGERFQNEHCLRGDIGNGSG
jgi:hypothetical protein